MLQTFKLTYVRNCFTTVLTNRYFYVCYEQRCIYTHVFSNINYFYLKQYSASKKKIWTLSEKCKKCKKCKKHSTSKLKCQKL